MKLLKPRAFSLLLVFAVGFGAYVNAQETDKAEIYLDEPEKEPPPKIMREDISKEKYDDDKIRVERGVAFLSDDQVVSHGKYVEYYRDGQKYSEGTHDMGLHVGLWKYWYPNGQICKSVTFKAGKPHGTWDVYRPDGSRELTKNYENGLRQGLWLSYFEDGEKHKVELTYDKGKIEGERIIYYENGQIRQKVPFENGLVHGTITNWDENGKKVSETKFEHGKPIGKPQRFDATTEATESGS